MAAWHPALAGFDRNAGAYERGRPGYPPEAVRFLAERLGLGPGRRAVDLAAGTGKMTRALRATGSRVLAVEPTRGMREEFRRVLGPDDLVAGSAEALPIASGRVDAVVVAQAFHWFDGPRALREVARVVRPGGGIALVWNLRDESVGWVRRLGELVEARGGPIPRYRTGAWRAAFETAASRAAFTPLERAEFPLLQRAPVETVVDRFVSVSSISTLGPADRDAVAAGIRSVLAEDPATAGLSEVEIPYRTEVYLARRRDGPAPG